MTRQLFHRVPFALASLLLLSSFDVPTPEPSDPVALKSELRVSRRFAAGLEYLVAEPRDVAPDAELPMVVWIHGRGSRPVPPTHAFLDLDVPVRVILPRAPEPYGDGYAWMPVSAHHGESPRLRDAIEARVSTLTEALGVWRRRHPTRGRPLVTGFSQGGILAAVVAVQSPGAVSHAFPVSGWLPPSFAPESVDRYGIQVPIHALHGADDAVLPAGRTREALGALRRAGYPVVYEELGDVGHELSPATLERLRALIRRALRDLPDTSEGSSLS